MVVSEAELLQWQVLGATLAVRQNLEAESFFKEKAKHRVGEVLRGRQILPYVYQLSAVPGFFIRLPGTADDRCFVVEDNILSRMLNVEPEQKVGSAQVLMLRWVSRHGRKLLLCAVSF